MQQVGNITQRNEMKLHVLPRGQMSFASSEIVSDPRQLTHLIRGEEASRHFRPDHLDPYLALTVDSATEAMRAELIVVDLAGQERIRLAAEQFDIAADRAIVFLLYDLQIRGEFGYGHSLLVYRDYHTSTEVARIY